MGGLVIEAAAILNEDNPEFFSELMKKGVDAVEPEMKRQQKKNMEINLKFEYKDLDEGDIEILLQNLQEDALSRGGMVYSITKIKDALHENTEVKKC